MYRWDDEKLKKFHNYVSYNKIEELEKSAFRDKSSECWKFLQAVVSSGSLSRRSFDPNATSVNLENLFNNPQLQLFILENSNYWAKFVQVLLNNADYIANSKNIFTKFLDRIVESEDKTRTTILENIWSERDNVLLSTKELQQIVSCVPHCLESSIINLMMADSDSVSTNILWRFQENSKIVQLSIHSPNNFQNIASIMNELLLKSHFNQRILDIVQSFIRAIMLQCAKDGVDFVSLYPLKCQSVVSFLILKNSLLPQGRDLETFEHWINQRMYILLEKESKLLICLLTHFPSSLHSFIVYCQNLNK